MPCRRLALGGLVAASLALMMTLRAPSTAGQFVSLERARRSHLRRRYRRHRTLVAESSLLGRTDVLDRIPRGGMAFFTLANSAYADLAINWALLLAPLLRDAGAEESYFICALDANITRELVARRLPTMRVGLNGSHESAADAPDTNFRLRFSHFRAMGVTKADVILWLLRHEREVVVSDVDCAWLALPHALLASYAEADVLGGTDCLDVREDDDRSERSRSVPRCGHHPGSHYGAWFNTGVLAFRPTPGGRAFAERWRDKMAAVHGDGTFGHQVDDQLTFNQLVEWNGSIGDRSAGHVYPIRSARADGRILFDASRTRRIAALPARAICSGHVFHIQQGLETRDCIVMHLTFVEADRAGKRWRLREAALFPVQPELVHGGRFLTYTPPRPRGATPPERHPSLLASSGPPKPIPHRFRWPSERGEGWSVATALEYAPRLSAHMALVDEHIFAMKQALALARVLGRQLIMPRLLCLCERAQQPWDVLPTCVKSGASTELPFVCPMENFLNVEELEGLWVPGFTSPWSRPPAKPPPQRPYVTLRPWTLLNSSFHPHAAAALRDETLIRWDQTSDEPNANKDDPNHANHANEPNEPNEARAKGGAGGATAAVGTHTTLRLPLGMTDEEWREAMAPHKDATLVRLDAANLPLFGGFVKAQEADAFEEEVRRWVIPGESRFSGSWCCSHSHYQAGTLLYKVPMRFPSGRTWADRPRSERVAMLQAHLPERRRRECYWDDCRDRRTH